MVLKFQPRPYQVAGHEALRENFRKGMRRQVLVMPTGTGKCLARGTEVLTFDGRRVKVEDVVVGDLLMGPDSRPRTVLSIASGHGPLRRVVPLRGEPWICNDAHILTLIHTQTSEIVDVSIDDWRRWSKTHRHLFKQFSVGVDFPKPASLTIDPYFLGVWFGDGKKTVDHLGLCGIKVFKPDEEIIAALRDVGARWGCTVTTKIYREGDCPAHSMTTPSGHRNPLLDEMRRVLGPDLFVPHEYLVASRADRLAFLAGWVDTDGHVDRGSIDFVQKRRDYADAVRFLACSLGFRVSMREKIVNGESYWRLSISGDASKIPTRIARNRGHLRAMNKEVTRTGFSIEDISDGPWHGFTLDGDGRFLLGNFVVTHNTGLAAMIIESAIAKGNEVLFLAHRKELIDQCSKTLDFFGVEHGVIKPRHWRDRPNAPVQVASVQTLIRRQHRPKARVVILDEAHRSLNATNQTIIGWYPDALSLGLTATPERLDGRGLNEMYETMVEPIKMSEAIAQGFILPTKVFEPKPRIDLRGIGRVGGDYNLEQVAERVMTKARNGMLVENWEKYAQGRRTIVSAVNIADSVAITARYNERGIPAEHLDGTMPEGKRDAILRRLDSGDTLVVVQCDVLVEGYDLPSVGCIQLARPTLSVTRFLQIIGRGSRPWEDQTYSIILDHADCCRRPQLGDPSRDREWSLEGRKKREKDPEGDVGMIACETCSAMRPANIVACPQCLPKKPAQVSMFAALPIEIEGMLVERNSNAETSPSSSASTTPVRRCKQCGATRMTNSRQSDLKIRWTCAACRATEYAVDTAAANKATDSRKFEEYLQLERIRVRKGRNPSWSAHLYKAVFGVFPPREWRAKVDEIFGKESA